MKVIDYLIACALVLSLALSLTSPCEAQYGGDPYRGYVDQMVLDRMNNRRLEERLKSRPHWKNHKRGKQPKVRTKSSSPVKTGPVKTGGVKRVSQGVKVVPTGSFSMSQDMYNSFGADDARGYRLEVKLTPQDKSGRTMTQSLQLNSNTGKRSGVVTKVPPGRYILTARSVDADGVARPALIGTQCGSPTDPQGGNFGSSLPITMEQIKNQWGRTEVHCRGPIWFRP